MPTLQKSDIKTLIQQKLKASAIHLIISAFLLTLILLYTFLIWYPSPYAEISGIQKIIAVLIGVDLVLGPLLTFIVYKKNKPRLKLDLTLIATVQISALIYGVHSIYQGHPAFVVFAIDRFELIAAKDINPSQARHQEFRISKLWLPKLAFVVPPSDRKEHNRLLFEVLFQGKPGMQWRPQYYEPMDNHLQEIIEKNWSPNAIFNSEEKKRKLLEFLRRYDQKEANLAFYPLTGKQKDVVIALERNTGNIIGTIDVNPWGE